MSQFWDTSQDQYYDVPDVDEFAAIPGTDIRPPPSDGDTMMRDVEDPDDDMERDLTPKRKLKRVYKGCRIGTGREMPEDTRDETIRGFMEAVAWAFGCQVFFPSQQPRLAVKKLLLPVRHSFTIGRSPEERQAARKGILEGPVLGVQCRGETSFGEAGVGPGCGFGELGDLLREVGAMLLLAQERARERNPEKKPGEGKWWTSKPRWGGGPGGPMGWEEEIQSQLSTAGEAAAAPAGNSERTKKRPLSNAEVNKVLSEPILTTETAPPAARKRHEPQHSQQRRSSGPNRGQPNGVVRRNMLAEKWKLVKPGLSLWDKRMRYMRVGRAGSASSEANFDDIFMVSSINHHISVLRLRVHDRYLLWLAGEEGEKKSTTSETDTEPEPEHQQEGRILEMKRTRWFDLFEAEDRRQAMEGLWRVMGWLMR